MATSALHRPKTTKTFVFTPQKELLSAFIQISIKSIISNTTAAIIPSATVKTLHKKLVTSLYHINIISTKSSMGHNLQSGLGWSMEL